jgi:hypothetical protein
MGLKSPDNRPSRHMIFNHYREAVRSEEAENPKCQPFEKMKLK